MLTHFHTHYLSQIQFHACFDILFKLFFTYQELCFQRLEKLAVIFIRVADLDLDILVGSGSVF